MLVACGVYGYSLNTIGSIIQDFFKKNQELDQKNRNNQQIYDKEKNQLIVII